MKKLPLAILLGIVLAALIFAFTRYDSVNAPTAANDGAIMNFEQCAAVYPVMESMPRQCRTNDGRLFAEEVATAEPTYVNASADDIRVELPFPRAVTGKEFTVVGQARGPWFFEASFPVQVLDKDGNQLATGIAQAQGEWMTTEFVGFTAQITIPQSYIGPATLVLKNDNPSGDPERDKSVRIPFTIEY